MPPLLQAIQAIFNSPVRGTHRSSHLFDRPPLQQIKQALRFSLRQAVLEGEIERDRSVNKLILVEQEFYHVYLLEIIRLAMFSIHRHLRVHYETGGEGPPLVLLHGWGESDRSFASLVPALQNQFRIYVIDLPGCGLSEPPAEVWTSEEYADSLEEFFLNRGLVRPMILGHSFGGKLALILALRKCAQKLVLIGSAGIRQPYSRWDSMQVRGRKLAKKWVEKVLPKKISAGIIALAKKHMGSKDYRLASCIMKEILTQVIEEDYGSMLPSIDVPCLLIWGEHDRVISLESAHKMKVALPQAKLIVVPGAGHHVHLEHPKRVLDEIVPFLN